MKYFSFRLIPAMALYASFAAVTYAAEAKPIPGLEFLQLNTDASIGDIFTRLYIWGIGFVALAAFLMLTAGGVRYMFAGDRDPGEAKQWMRNAVYGLLLALGSYLILYTINPQLVTINITELPKITAPSDTGGIVDQTCDSAHTCKAGFSCAGDFNNPGNCYLPKSTGTCQDNINVCQP